MPKTIPVAETAATTRVLRTPSEDPQWLSKVTEAGLGAFDLQDGCAVAIFGSVAEGLGNDASDIDILVVTPGEDRYSQGRFMTAYEDRRVEIFVRGVESLRAFARLVRSSTSASTEQLDYYHRYAFALPIKDTPSFADVRAEFDHAWLIDVHCRKETQEAQKAFARAVLASRLHRGMDAIGYGKKALEHAAAHYACARGETYLTKKFLLRRLERAGVGASLLAQYRELQGAPAVQSAPDFLADVQRVAAALGVTLDSDAEWSLSRRKDLQIVAIAAHCVVSRAGRSVVVHDPEGDLKTTLNAKIDVQAAQARRHAQALGVLHRLGMLEAAAGDHHWIDERPHPPIGELRIISTGVQPSEDIVFADVPAAAIVDAGLAILDAIFCLENRDEDVVGAVRRKDWLTVHSAMQVMARKVALIVLCHELRFAMLEDHEYLEALHLEPAIRELASVAAQIETFIVRDAADVPRCYDLFKKMRAMIPSGVISRHFYRSHHNAIQWAKLATYIYPIWTQALEQVGGVVAGHLREIVEYDQPQNFPVKDEKREEVLRWSRAIDLETEIDRLRVLG